MPLITQPWRLVSGEAVLREVPVLHKKRDRGERDNPRQRLYNFALFAGLGAYVLYTNLTSVLEQGVEWWNYLGVPMGIGFVFLGILTARKTQPTPFANMDRYVFTNMRLALLDASSRALDIIAPEEIDDVILDERTILLLRAGDDAFDRSFSVLYIENPQDVFEFVRDTYT